MNDEALIDQDIFGLGHGLLWGDDWKRRFFSKHDAESMGSYWVAGASATRREASPEMR
jgi:hypothetical protein